MFYRNRIMGVFCKNNCNLICKKLNDFLFIVSKVDLTQRELKK